MGIRQMARSLLSVPYNRYVLVHGTDDEKKRDAAEALAEGGILGVYLLCNAFHVLGRRSSIAGDALLHLLEVDDSMSMKKVVARTCRIILLAPSSFLKDDVSRARRTTGSEELKSTNASRIGVPGGFHKQEIRAIDLLGRVGSKRSAATLNKRLRVSVAATSTYPEYAANCYDARRHEMKVCAAITNALRKIAGPSLDECVETLVRGLKDPDQAVRREFVEFLGQVGSPKAISELKSSLRNEDDGVRMGAAKELRGLNWEPVTDEERVWYYIALHDFQNALSMGEEALVPMLTVLPTFDYLTIPIAGQAIGTIGDADAIGPLEEAAKLATRLYDKRQSRLDMDVPGPDVRLITEAIARIRERVGEV